MTENKDQIALRRWITAGLAIEEVTDMNGDAGYLFSNMIAKYTLGADQYDISEKALEVLMEMGVDLNKTYKRAKFYGKKSPFIYEHTIPASVIRKMILECDGSEQSVKDILSSAGRVTVILREEDRLLVEGQLNSKMPEGWKVGDNPQERYDKVGIVISDQVLNVNGAIYR